MLGDADRPDKCQGPPGAILIRMGPRLEHSIGDITAEHTDAIVNAANTELLEGGGVDGAIHSAAGPALAAECRLLGGCDVGEAKVTKGYQLPSRWVIHTVGPHWRGGNDGEPDLLASCYRNSLARADEIGAQSVAFPAISTGIYGYPAQLAARIAVTAARSTDNRVGLIRFICFDQESFDAYSSALDG